MKILPWLLAVLASALSFWAGTAWQRNPDKAALISPKDGHRPAGLAAARKEREQTKASMLSSAVPFPEPGEEAQPFKARVRNAFNERNEFRRLQLFHRALAAMKPAEAMEEQAIFNEHDRQGRYFIPEYAYFTRRWGEVDGPAAMAFAVKEWEKKDFMSGIIAQMMGGWATQQPLAATGWINQNENVPDWLRTTAISGLTEGLAKVDPEQARQLVESRLDDPGIDKYLSVLADEFIYASGLERADAWFGELPPALSTDSKRRLGNLLVDRHLRAGPQSAAAYVSQHMQEPWFDQSSAMNVARQFLKDDAAGARQWANTMPENAPLRL